VSISWSMAASDGRGRKHKQFDDKQTLEDNDHGECGDELGGVQEHH
jgi:hypothetical protein